MSAFGSESGCESVGESYSGSSGDSSGGDTVSSSDLFNFGTPLDYFDPFSSQPFAEASTGSSSVTAVDNTNTSKAQSNLRWVDETTEFIKKDKKRESSSGKVVSSTDVEKIRKRFMKKKSRPLVQLHVTDTADVKKARNTLAARRYRERQKQDFEILDARIKQLEEELAASKTETLWWQMEAKRWKEEALSKRDPN